MTYYCCRSEAVSKGLKEGALCNKPNKEVIDRSTGRSPPARIEAAALAVARFSLLLLSVVHSLLCRFCLEHPGFRASLVWLGMEE